MSECQQTKEHNEYREQKTEWISTMTMATELFESSAHNNWIAIADICIMLTNCAHFDTCTKFGTLLEAIKTKIFRPRGIS